jgi:hypothetical protein
MVADSKLLILQTGAARRHSLHGKVRRHDWENRARNHGVWVHLALGGSSFFF